MLRYAAVCRHLLNGTKQGRKSINIQTPGRYVSVQLLYHTNAARNPISTENYTTSILNQKWCFFTKQIRFYVLPPHTKMVLPALSPTMETGTIKRWEVNEGDSFSAGDLLAEIETDKATVGFDANDDGYIAKIILPDGSKDIPLGTLVAISVENEDEVPAFKDISIDEINSQSDASTVNAPVASEAPSPAETSSTQSTNYPPHDLVELPALSPTMTTGTIISWERKVGDKLEEGDAVAIIETDKASMAMEYQDEGYLAKILLEEGAKDLPLGTPLCVIVSNQEDIAAFADFTAAAAPAVDIQPPSAQPSTPSPAAPSHGIPPPTPMSTPGDRIFASPLAKKLAFEKGIDLALLAGLGSGPLGRIRAQDLDKAGKAVAQPVAPAVAVSPEVASFPHDADGSFVDIPVSNIRKITAKRLFESKQTIPHYYLTVDVEMDKVVALRKSFNTELEKEGTKISVNDFFIKASAMACLKIPEANSSWRDTFIRQHNTVDMSIAVSTESGLITPIVFNAHTKGLVAISQDVVSLAGKAREGKLQPSEFMGGTFTLSNLGMFGVKHFSAIINPPQACILAVGSARRELLPDKNAENGFREATVVSVTLSCDHRVVDGAVGAQWLQHFKKFMEDPTKMLL
uniref:Acetyltransferase component of pyruvate dehydrogenase complex n=1 Tax=Ciona savignyi TaxID=51511 RepID=H2YN60_CIOSA